ncbi:MAG: nitrate reductase subunit beta [Gammaproteobacteria bacterium]|nr:nitrate reductase subunit beta [Gammaproteobacteria bacterium]
MDVRAQVSMVFHLDKCIGCHTCSIACKNIWTDRKGAEYMWWNNVETKPGTGFPRRWEDQAIYRGGWEKDGDTIVLKGAGKAKGLLNLFHNPALPVLDDYYEPYTYQYLNLIEAPAGEDQPTARPVSLITGRPMDIKMGPNWDDDLSGTPDYARQDPNLADLSLSEREALFTIERLAFFYLPRICNHCLNPACVASCPSGALYKRGEDGIVLINQDVCRAWRMCVTACPYKKTYFNWSTGKSEKCILCYPRLEAGLAPACMHSCVGRIRYLGVLLYDAEQLHAAASAPEAELVARQLDLILDPDDPAVAAAARASGVPESTLEAARRSPVYAFVKRFGLALPLHAEFRTLPMLFYVPPLSPVMASLRAGDGEDRPRHAVAKRWDEAGLYDTRMEELFADGACSRLSLRYLARLFAVGDEAAVAMRLRRLLAVRLYRRQQTVGDLDAARLSAALDAAGYTAETAEAVYRLTALAKFDERFVVPPAHRETAIEALEATDERKGAAGFGFNRAPRRP